MNKTQSLILGAVLGVAALVGIAAVNVVPSTGGITGSTITVSNIIAYGYAEVTTAHADAGAWTIDLSATNRIWSCVNTGAVAITFSNFTTDNQAKIVFGNSQATNCAVSYTTAGTVYAKWLGLVLTNMAPAKWQTVYIDCKTVTGTNYVFLTGAEEQL